MTDILKHKIPSSLSGTLNICATFHFDVKRLDFLRESLANSRELATIVNLTVVTNVKDKKSIRLLEENLPQGMNDVEIVCPNLIGHPFFLTWIHFDVFRKIIESDSPGDYFLYKEDDTTFTSENIRYWIEGTQDLDNTPFYPSFVRYEQLNKQSEIYLTDVTQRVRLFLTPKIKVSKSRHYVNFSENYQGLYLLDRSKMEIHLNSKSSHPDNGEWGIREKATRGLSLHSVPKGFHSRNLVRIDVQSKRIHPGALIRHIPNNYLLDPNTPHAKIKINKCFY